MLHEQYIEGVESGEIPTCEYTKLAVKRHLNDLERSETEGFPYYFDVKEVQRINKIVGLHKHVEGRRFANKPFEQLPWQAFVRANVYGWKQVKNAYRRFKRVYIEVPRKNGKSTDRAIDCSIGLLFDKEEGAQVYTAATKREQARIVFDMARNMIAKLASDHDEIKELVTVFQHNVHVLSTNSKFEALASEAKTMDGTNPSTAIVDEWGAHKTDDVYKSLETGMIGRDQALLWAITTAYPNIGGPCYVFRKSVIDVLRGIQFNESLFGNIYTIDEGDDWEDPTVWAKANPGSPNNPTMDALQTAYESAKMTATGELHFKTKHLNVWTRSSLKYISDETWKKNGGVIDYDKLKGRKCWAGLDMSRVKDLTALVLLFPPMEPGEKFVILPYFWCPLDTIDKRSSEEGIQYEQWRKDGHIIPIPGKTIKDDYIESKIDEVIKKYQLITLEYDPRYAHQLITSIEGRVTCSAFSQSSREFTSPIKKLEGLAIEEQLNHGYNPILRWMNSNVELKEYPNDGLMMDKSKSIDRIDGMVALAMAVGGWETDKDDHGPSKYEDEDVLVINF